MKNALKTQTYKNLLIAPFLVLSVLVYGQNPRIKFENKYQEAQSLLYDQPERAVALGFEAYEIAKASEDIWAMAIAKYGIGFMSYEVGDYEAAYKNYVSALETLTRADTSDDYNRVVILNEISLIHSDFNNHDESIKFSQQALDVAKRYVKKYPRLARENGAGRWLVDIPYYMAIEYQAKGAHHTAGEILMELWNKAEDKKDIEGYAQVLNELGIIKSNNAEFSQAQEYLGLVVSSNEVDDEYKSIAYHNLANTYMEQGEYERAESYFLIGLDMAIVLEDTHSQFITYQDIGELEYRRKNNSRAIEYWEMALQTYADIDTDPELYKVYDWLQLAYMDVDIEKAKEYNRKYAQLNDFYVKNQTIQRELETQNREILNALISEQRQQRIDADQRQRFFAQFWPLLLGVALLVLFSFFLGVRYYLALKSNKLLSRRELKLQGVKQVVSVEDELV